MVCCLVTRYHITGEIPIALIPHHQDNHATPTWQTTEHNPVLTNMHPYLTQIPLKNPPPTQQECIPYATEKFSLTGIEPISLYSPFLPPYNYHSLTTQRPTEKPSVWWNMPQTGTGIPNHQTYQTTVPYHLRQTLAPPIPHIQKTYIITRTELTLKVPPDYANPID